MHDNRPDADEVVTSTGRFPFTDEEDTPNPKSSDPTAWKFIAQLENQLKEKEGQLEAKEEEIGHAKRNASARSSITLV